MNRTWWRTPSELDADQRAFIDLPASGRYMLVGPPGSGKTNLLLLRMQYYAGIGQRNTLFVTYTRNLADFIRAGIGASGFIQPTQVQTYHSWAFQYVRDYGDVKTLPDRDQDFDQSRAHLLDALKKASSGMPSSQIYDAIFVDEAQDLTVDELTFLLGLSSQVCVSGDGNQGIYGKDGLNIESALHLEKRELRTHFRIGPKIARVADKLIKPEPGAPGLAGTSNYDSQVNGKSSAVMNPCTDRDEQFLRMTEALRVELDAFPDEILGILCAKNETLVELRSRFDGTDLKSSVSVHGVDNGASFADSRRIHALTIHSAKGAEFRAAHIYGAEDLVSFPLNRTRLAFTAVTRAKTALNVYRSGPTTPALETALAEEVDFDWRELFPGDDDA